MAHQTTVTVRETRTPETPETTAILQATAMDPGATLGTAMVPEAVVTMALEATLVARLGEVVV